MPQKKKAASDASVEVASDLWERKKAVYRKLEVLRGKIEEKERYLRSL